MLIEENDIEFAYVLLHSFLGMSAHLLGLLHCCCALLPAIAVDPQRGLDGCRSSCARGGAAFDLLTDGGGYLCAEQLDGAHHLLVRQRTDADLRHKALVAEELVLVEDFLYNLLRAADDERSARRATHLELPTAHRRPPALLTDPVHHRSVGGKELVTCLLGRLGHEGVRVDADGQPRRVVTGPSRGLTVEPGERHEVLGLAADDRYRKWQT